MNYPVVVCIPLKYELDNKINLEDIEKYCITFYYRVVPPSLLSLQFRREKKLRRKFTLKGRYLCFLINYQFQQIRYIIMGLELNVLKEIHN